MRNNVAILEHTNYSVSKRNGSGFVLCYEILSKLHTHVIYYIHIYYNILQELNGTVCNMILYIDMEKAYDRVNRKKLFEVMRGYGVQGILVDVIESIYSGSMVKFELESILTGVGPSWPLTILAPYIIYR